MSEQKSQKLLKSYQDKFQRNQAFLELKKRILKNQEARNRYTKRSLYVIVFINAIIISIIVYLYFKNKS